MKPYVFAKYDEVDVDYYINNQVVPAAARILSFFGVKKNNWLMEKRKKAKEIKKPNGLFLSCWNGLLESYQFNI